MPLTFSGPEDSLPPPGGKDVEVTPGGTPAPTGTGKRRGRPPGSTNKKNLPELEKKLTEKLLEELVVPIAFASPLAAANIEMRAERTAKAAVSIAARNPAVRKSIERFLDGSEIFTLVLFPISTAVCFMVDWGTIPANSMPARAVGVPKIMETMPELYGHVFSGEAASTNGHVEDEAVKPRGLFGETE